jgi:hypothetical protein
MTGSVSGAAFQIELTPEALPPRTDLARFPFAVLLANARMLGVTGILELRGEKRIFIARGSPVHVESDLADETSELYLLRTGAVDASELAPARELARSQGGKIGEALLGLGLIEANELFEHTRNRARDGLIACFQWETGSAVWEPRERFGPDILAIPIDVVRVFFDGILRFYDRRRLDRELPVDDNSRITWCPAAHRGLHGVVGAVRRVCSSSRRAGPRFPAAPPSFSGRPAATCTPCLPRRHGFEVTTLLEHCRPPSAALGLDARPSRRHGGWRHRPSSRAERGDRFERRGRDPRDLAGGHSHAEPRADGPLDRRRAAVERGATAAAARHVAPPASSRRHPPRSRCRLPRAPRPVGGCAGPT